MKKKLFILLLSIISVICLAFGISACSESGGQSGGSDTEQSQSDSTDSSSNNSGQSSEDDTGGSHVHVYTRIPAVDATCESTGNIEYWYCYGCCKYFADSNGDTEISQSDTVIAKLAHTAGEAVEENRVEATCTETGSYDSVVYCSVCGEEISRQTIIIPATDHIEGEAVTENYFAAMCEKDGSYDLVVYCSVCGEEISRETVTIPATDH
ncbi:MAG: hypothetical protein LUD27_02785, partial [Clostridia bacterium]|nr:hypothetical protein [Clostridia bacterium]